jgi:hypothetical protein
VISEDDSDGPPHASLPNLRKLQLTGYPRFVFGLLHRIGHPRNMDLLSIYPIRCTARDISEVVGPYLRDNLRRRGSSQKLGVHLTAGDKTLTFRAGDVSRVGFPARGPVQLEEEIKIVFLSPEASLVTEFAAHVPWEEIFCFRVGGCSITTKDLPVQLPSIRALHLGWTTLSVFDFKEGRDVFPSVQHVILESVYPGDEDGWDPLVGFLERRVSCGNRIDTIEIIGSHPEDPVVDTFIRGAVREYRIK